jgi:hypothetical protein
MGRIMAAVAAVRRRWTQPTGRVALVRKAA